VWSALEVTAMEDRQFRARRYRQRAKDIRAITEGIRGDYARDKLLGAAK